MQRLTAYAGISCFMIFSSGCGTYVPSLQEMSPQVSGEQQLVQAIVTSIHCDLSNAVKSVIDKDIEQAEKYTGKRNIAWLDNWGAQVTITLTIEEKTTLNPNIAVASPAETFKFAIGFTGSAIATRTNKVNYFYTVKELYNRAYCQQGIQPAAGAPSPLIQNNLRARDWLFDQIAPSGTGEGPYPISSDNVFKQNVLSHDIKFQITTSSQINPSWQLTRVIIDSNGTLLGTGRDRISDLLVTFGPLDPKQNNKSLIPQAESIHNVQQFGLAVSTNSFGSSRTSIFP